MNNESVKRKSGFTLIELLVVVAIIGVLATVILASLGSARDKAREARYKSEIKNMQTALEMYRLDNDTYPVRGYWSGICSSFGSRGDTGSNGWVPNLAPDYIPVLPLIPDSSSTICNGYVYMGGSDGYVLLLHEADDFGLSLPPNGDYFYDPQRPTRSWKVCSEEVAGTWCSE